MVSPICPACGASKARPFTSIEEWRRILGDRSKPRTEFGCPEWASAKSRNMDSTSSWISNPGMSRHCVPKLKRSFASSSPAEIFALPQRIASPPGFPWLSYSHLLRSPFAYRCAAFLVRLFARQVGRRHAGGGNNRIQRQSLARWSLSSPQRVNFTSMQGFR